MSPIEIVVAVDSQMGIGKNGQLPWHLPGDLRRLREMTTATADPSKRNAVVMGRRTWESIPGKFRPLRGRLNLVLTRRDSYPVPEGVTIAHGFEAALSALDTAASPSVVETAFILGGASVYRAAIASPRCARLHLTRVEGDFNCDTFLDDPSADFTLSSASDLHEEGGVAYRFELHDRIGGSE